MTNKERFLRTLNREPIEGSLPRCESLWPETLRKYTVEGHIREGEDLLEHFDRASRLQGVTHS